MAKIHEFKLYANSCKIITPFVPTHCLFFFSFRPPMWSYCSLDEAPLILLFAQPNLVPTSPCFHAPPCVRAHKAKDALNEDSRRPDRN